MHYIGSGTEFPFEKLQSSVMESSDAQPIRVIISDSDFDYNYDEHEQAASILAEAIQSSQQFLARLDYRSLLNEAEQAKLSAEERMNYLRKLREQQEMRLGRRGKF